jgi:hypothetical protein
MAWGIDKSILGFVTLVGFVLLRASWELLWRRVFHGSVDEETGKKKSGGIGLI